MHDEHDLIRYFLPTLMSDPGEAQLARQLKTVMNWRGNAQEDTL